MTKELPTVLENIIVEYLDDPDEACPHSTYLNQNFQYTFFEKRLYIFTLLQHAIRGDYNEVNRLLTHNPLLLLEKGSVTDMAHRKLKDRTVYQIALGAHDYDIKDMNGNILSSGMIEMIEKHFKKLPGKTISEINQIIHEQYASQFPEHVEKNERKKLLHNFSVLNQIMDTIKHTSSKLCSATSKVEHTIHHILCHDKYFKIDTLTSVIQNIITAKADDVFNEAFKQLSNYLIIHKKVGDNFDFELLKALYQFRYHLEPKETQTYGSHFNYRFLTKAAELYDNYYLRFGDSMTTPKNSFYWEHVLTYIERLIPTRDAQIIAQGLLHVLRDKEFLHNTLKFRDKQGNYFPYLANPSWHAEHNVLFQQYFDDLNFIRRGSTIELQPRPHAVEIFSLLASVRIETPKLMQFPAQPKIKCSIM